MDKCLWIIPFNLLNILKMSLSCCTCLSFLSYGKKDLYHTFEIVMKDVFKNKVWNIRKSSYSFCNVSLPLSPYRFITYKNNWNVFWRSKETLSLAYKVDSPSRWRPSGTTSYFILTNCICLIEYFSLVTVNLKVIVL